jgi:(1->4)-alpha-D-glucan 1-alpha-D-glucosylmutase
MYSMNENPQNPEDQRLRTLIRESIYNLSHEKKVPSSVYRIQLNNEFPFEKVQSLLDYFVEIGVEGLYFSPFLQAVPGSLHGYNVTDPEKVNNELGGEAQFRQLAIEAKKRELYLIEDIVPNHMGNHFTNPYWMDVLEHGKASRYAKFFDITWDSDKLDLTNKVLLPILGNQFGVVLENGELKLSYEDGKFWLRYWDHLLPISPDTYDFILEQNLPKLEEKLGVDHPDVMRLESIITAFRHLPGRNESDEEEIHERYRESEVTCMRLGKLLGESPEISAYLFSELELLNGKPGTPESFDLLEELLYKQAYRLSSWRVASEEINYRRFFDVNDLVAIKVENPDVFRQYHSKTLEFLRKGWIHGLRIDHTDGLYDPPHYFNDLQKAYLEIALQRIVSEQKIDLTPEVQAIIGEEIEALNPVPVSLLVVIEKILERKESLPESWSVSGTTGYEFLNLLNGLFVNRDSQELLHKFYLKFTGFPIEYEELLYNQKKKFIRIQMPGEINMLGRRLKRISSVNRRYRDFTLNSLVKGLTEVIACFPVYRTYVSSHTQELDDRDRHYMHIAIEKARSKNQLLSPSVFDFIEDVLSLKVSGITDEEEKAYREFVLRFQQLSSPIMAKGMEDTTFYIQNRLVSLNEVGGDPEYFGYSPQEFHRQNGERLKYWPHSFLPTSTHDTKRSEDVRMRINVITENPKDWRKIVQRWHRINGKYKSTIDGRLQPDRNTEYLIYQTLLGIWPDYPIEKEYWPSFRERVWQYFQKAVREAKVFTSWIHVNEPYEQAVKDFIYKCLEPSKNRYFFRSFLAYQKEVSRYGKWNSLCSLVLKFGSPGIPDTYQSNELWDYSLVDPDNRRPVDYDLRFHLLRRVQGLDEDPRPWQERAQELVDNMIDSRMKVLLIWKLLSLRKHDPDLFLQGDYLPLDLDGPASKNLVAYARRRENRWIIFVAARFLWLQAQEIPEGNPWEGTSLILPEDCAVKEFRSPLWKGQVVGVQEGRLDMSQLMEVVPFFVGSGGE